MKAKLDFGDYCTIEQKRFFCKNEHYLYKVISVGISNTWVDVPIEGVAKETRHDQMEDVVSCVVCGVCETEILRYRLSDVKKSRKRRSYARHNDV